MQPIPSDLSHFQKKCLNLSQKEKRKSNILTYHCKNSEVPHMLLDHKISPYFLKRMPKHSSFQSCRRECGNRFVIFHIAQCFQISPILYLHVITIYLREVVFLWIGGNGMVLLSTLSKIRGGVQVLFHKFPVLKFN